jgi:hypothetical protein
MRAGLLDVVTVISNPVQYQSRGRLYTEFKRRMRDAGVRLITVELAYGDRPFEVTSRWHRRHLQVRLPEAEILWSKENLVDLGISKRSSSKYVAWIDGDVQFQRGDWASATVQELQTRQVVQLFSHGQDLGPSQEAVGVPKAGFMYSYVNGYAPTRPRYDGGDWHPGYAWAIRRDTYERMGGLIDRAVLGSGDRHMAMAMVGKAALSYPGGVTSAYKEMVLGWQAQAETVITRDVGYVVGLLYHHWHGRKSQRGYDTRWKILVEEKYNPNTDVRYRMENQILVWKSYQDPRLQRLRDRVRAYMSARNEDSIDLV